MRRSLCRIITLLSLLLFAGEAEAKYEDGKIYLKKEELTSYAMLELGREFVNWHKLDELMDELEASVKIDPMDATLDENMQIVDEVPGSTIDRKGFQSNFLEAFYQERDQMIAIPKKVVHARVDRQLLQEITQKRLGTFTTFYNPKNQERSTNIMLSAEAIHGTVIFPGDIFSFNETVGERTEEKGYKRAPVIVKGEFAEDIGGGICQVSSTLFNAVDLRGIQMVERFTHSRRVPYVPPGRDATVSWWGPDFSFKNLYNEPVVITARANHGILTVDVYSSETVEYFQPN